MLVDSFVGHWANWLINAVRCYLVTARNPADCFLLFYRNSQLRLQKGIVVVEVQSRRTAGKWRIKRLMTSHASWELLPLSCPMCPSVISKIKSLLITWHFKVLHICEEQTSRVLSSCEPAALMVGNLQGLSSLTHSRGLLVDHSEKHSHTFVVVLTRLKKLRNRICVSLGHWVWFLSF